MVQYIALLEWLSIPPDVPDVGKVSDRRADVLKACWTAAEAAVRLMQPGNKNTQVSEILQKSADEFKCQPAAGGGFLGG